ncbi:MAG: MurR/RpiR family transcriptional regulator [Roseicyclus sp.]
MAPASKTSFLARIRDATPGLHPSELRLAEAILRFPGQLASYTATELSQMAGVSNATVTRFVRKIGYSSFEEARQAVRAEQDTGTALFRVDREGVPRDCQAARHLDQCHGNLERSLAHLDDAEIGTLVSAMLGADRLWVVGFRAGQSFARYLAWQVMQVRPNAFTLPRDGETMSESLAGIGPDDCVIIIALRRPPKQFGALIDMLNESGAQTALIGDLPGLEGMPARWTLPCSTTGAGALFDHVGVMALCGLLASGVIEGSGSRGRERLRVIESLHESLDEL